MMHISHAKYLWKGGQISTPTEFRDFLHTLQDTVGELVALYRDHNGSIDFISINQCGKIQGSDISSIPPALWGDREFFKEINLDWAFPSQDREIRYNPDHVMKIEITGWKIAFEFMCERADERITQRLWTITVNGEIVRYSPGSVYRPNACGFATDYTLSVDGEIIPAEKISQLQSVYLLCDR